MKRRGTSVSKLLAPSEWRIFSLLTRRHPLAISEITQELNRGRDPQHALAESTVRTVVKRLKSKGYLTTTANDDPSSPALVYGPGVPLELALRLHVRNFLDHYALAGTPDLRLVRDVVEERLTASGPLAPLLDRIKVEPSRSLIRGTSVTVDSVLERLASGSSTEDILADHSELSREDVQAAVAFARAALITSAPPEFRH
jgi:uncharacterized protein (DUF433 family)